MISEKSLVSKQYSLSRYGWSAGLILAIISGVVFRMIWLGDIEYKGDERWTFEHLRVFTETGAVPLIGMPSSIGLPNAGMSIWIFLGLAQLFPFDTPPELVRAEEWINIASILLMLGFIFRCVNRAERELWLWSTALVSVNPVVVLLHRKIWPHSIFPIFALTMLLGWWNRQYRWGAFLWGAVGALLGQIQLGGFLFAAAFVFWILLFDRHSVRWVAWCVGSLIGSIPMIPWLIALLGSPSGPPIPSLLRLLKGFFWAYWLGTASGLDLYRSLQQDFIDFLSRPVINGHQTYLTFILWLLLAGLFLAILLRVGQRLLRSWRPVVADLFDTKSQTVLAINAAFWMYGILLTATLRPTYLHYILIAFVLPFLWLAWLARIGSTSDPRSIRVSRLLLAALCLGQALLTICFLSYIHEKQDIRGDYGITYNRQQHPNG